MAHAEPRMKTVPIRTYSLEPKFQRSYGENGEKKTMKLRLVAIQPDPKTTYYQKHRIEKNIIPVEKMTFDPREASIENPFECAKMPITSQRLDFDLDSEIAAEYMQLQDLDASTHKGFFRPLPTRSIRSSSVKRRQANKNSQVNVGSHVNKMEDARIKVNGYSHVELEHQKTAHGVIGIENRIRPRSSTPQILAQNSENQLLIEQMMMRSQTPILQRENISFYAQKVESPKNKMNTTASKIIQPHKLRKERFKSTLQNFLGPQRPGTACSNYPLHLPRELEDVAFHECIV